MICYVDDAQPGITRRRYGRGWAYFAADGTRITDRDEITRLSAIGLPPAYKNCWFCTSSDGHIQAIGYDEKGRKQYRYHLDHRAQQEAAKYGRCADFGRALPAIRAHVEQDLATRDLSKDRAVAAVVRLLDLGHVRVGNEQYAQANQSFGATTLRTRHARIRGERLSLRYMGKSGKEQKLTIEDKALARLVRKCQDLPGQHLFQYLDADGQQHPVDSHDVNEYIRAAGDGDFTAKHFRTWGASVIAFTALAEAGSAPITLKQMLEPVAKALGNTPAISRKSYVHPALIEVGKAGTGFGSDYRLPRSTQYLSREERGLIAFLDVIAAAEESAQAEADRPAEAA